jgi:Protein of unknown function (DUF1580)
MIAPTEIPPADSRLSDLIPLTQVACELPRRRGGKKTHIATLYRWCSPGCRGVRLRYVQCGATRCTTRAWLNEFFEALAARSTSPTPADDRGGPVPASALPPSGRTATARRRAVEAADRELARAGA